MINDLVFCCTIFTSLFKFCNNYTDDIISCLDPDSEEIDLEDLRITLDITCLTVPSDIKNPNVERHRVYSTSFSSSSPVPEADFYRKRQATNENESDTSE